ncbi:MAG: DUF134 domain-containing protein [Desulfobacterales bacterium]
MPRPKKTRFVSQQPHFDTFGPLNALPTGEVFLSMEEMEAIRLSDVEGMDQEAAAKLMGVSRQTYGRILSEARSIMGHALVTGKIVYVEGGNFEFRGHHRGRRRRGMCNAEERGCDMPNRNGTGPGGKGKGGSGCGSGKSRGKGQGCQRGGKGQGSGRGGGQKQGGQQPQDEK